MPIIPNICVLTLLLSMIPLGAQDHTFTIMIDPAGDAKHTGRLIQDTLERGISLQCAEQLKAKLVQKFPAIRVVLTRVPGETIQHLQNASFSNRLGVDLYLSLYFYQEEESPSHITLYFYVQDPIADFWHKSQPLAFYNVEQAHLMSIHLTKAWGEIFLDVFNTTSYSKFFQCRGLLGVPFTPLIGIKAPALAVEVGLKNKQDWQHIIDPIVIAIEKIIA